MSEYGVQVIFCTGLERIESAGHGNLRFRFFELRGDREEPVLDLIMPGAAAPDGVLKTLAALAMVGAAAIKTIPRLMTMH